MRLFMLIRAGGDVEIACRKAGNSLTSQDRCRGRTYDRESLRGYECIRALGSDATPTHKEIRSVLERIR